MRWFAYFLLILSIFLCPSVFAADEEKLFGLRDDNRFISYISYSLARDIFSLKGLQPETTTYAYSIGSLPFRMVIERPPLDARAYLFRKGTRVPLYIQSFSLHFGDTGVGDIGGVFSFEPHFNMKSASIGVIIRYSIRW